MYDLSNDPYGNNYEGTGIIPRDKGNTIKEDNMNQNKMLKEIWAIEMEEKKIRKEKEREKQKELDILEDERIRREIEEEKQKKEEEEQRKKQKEKNIIEENNQLLQNKKSLIENGNDKIDPIQMNFNNYNKKTVDANSNIFIHNDPNNLYNKLFLYKNIDLNNIHFYRRKDSNNNINKKNNNKRLNRNLNNRKVNEFEFSPNPRALDDSKNPQISKLKKEVNLGYMEISSLFKQLKNNVIEANQNKNRAENELKYITNEINKEKKYHLQIEKKKYDQMKPEEMYNNYYANVRDVDPIYNIKNVNNIKENNMSNLAKVGQNLIRLTAQSEFIPIGSNNIGNNIIIEANNGLNEGINELGDNIQINEDNNNVEIESETIFQQNENANY